MDEGWVPYPEQRNYGCVNCGSINHTTGDTNWCPVERATGDCFPVAFRLVEQNRDWRLCHGLVTRSEDGLRHYHAWAERTEVHDVPFEDRFIPVPLTIAVDQSNGNNVALPAAFYRKVGQAIDVIEYTFTEAARLAVRAKHYGPWC